MCAYGAFTIRNSVFDVVSVAVLGAMAYGLTRVNIPLTPIILGLVLGPSIEREFRTALILSEGEPSIFVGSVPAAVFLGLALVVVSTQVVRTVRATLIARKMEDKARASVTPSE